MKEFNIVTIEIPVIHLSWSDWVIWKYLVVDARTNMEGRTPPNKPGVYEVRTNEGEERLTIGKASNLRMRIKQGLVKGKTPHSSGIEIRARENSSNLVVRWAETEWPSAAEEALHREYKSVFGSLPKYTKRT
jgi:excinuclease UvrABC nuclease subunit